MNMVADSTLNNGDLAVDFVKQGHTVLADHILRQIEITVKRGAAYPGFLDDLGGGDIRKIFGFQ